MSEPSEAEVSAFIASHEGGGTLEEVAEVLGCTRERTRQIINAAIAKVLVRLQRYDIAGMDDLV